MRSEHKLEIICKNFSKKSRRERAKDFFEKYKDNPEEGLNKIYEIIKIVPSGQGGDDTGIDHRASLHSAFFCLIGYLEFTPEHKYWNKAVKHLRDQYVDGQGRYDDDRFDNELDNFLAKYTENGVYVPPDDIERKSKVKIKQDKKQLRRLPRVTIEDTVKHFNKIRKGVDKPHEVKTIDFLKKVFNSEVISYKTRANTKSKNGYFATSPDARGAYIYNLEREEEIQKKIDGDNNYSPPPNTVPAMAIDGRQPVVTNDYKSITTHRFMCNGIFPQHGQEGQRRLKKEVVHSAFVVFECDDYSTQMQEHFNYLMCKFAECATPIYIIYTGGKSYHFGFMTMSVNPKIVDAFKQKAALYCADAGVLNNPVSYVRLPNTPPEKEGRSNQVMLYFSEYNTRPSNIEDGWSAKALGERLEKIEKPELYHNKNIFYKKGEDTLEDVWIGLTRHSMVNQLHLTGMRKVVIIDEEDISECERYLALIENTKTVDYVHSALSGYRSGLHIDDKSNTHLVLKNISRPELLNEKCEGKFPTIDAHIRKLFKGEAEVQIFLGKLSEDLKALYNKGRDIADFSYQSLYMVIVGKAGNGKSLLRTAIMEPLFGASCSAEAYLTGSNWTGEESKSPLKWLDDARGLKDSPTARKELGLAIKNINNDSIRKEEKFMDALTIKIFEVLVHFCNYEELGVLPDLNDNTVSTKMTILETNPYDEDNPSRQMPREEALIKAKLFKEEIPMFYTYLIKEHVIPEEYRGDRFAVKPHISEGIKDRLHEGSPAAFLESILLGDKIIYSNTTIEDEDMETHNVWHGTSTELYTLLVEALNDGDKKVFNKYFYTPKVFTKELQTVCLKSDVIAYSNGFKEHGIESLIPKKPNGRYYYRLYNVKEMQETEGQEL